MPSEIREIPMSEWGKDHWSCFAYFACCAMDLKGVVDFRRMRQDGEKYPTILKITKEPGHNDYHCLDDLIREGFVANYGTGCQPVIRLTDRGIKTWAQLSKHKQEGGMFNTFQAVD